ncbi:2-amino-3-ketobutyrate CoA ligase [Pandoraea pnomenusa 3kgm]|uniref:glycine C-acetyltransferase n=1 Tax=Pandoraea pnomenusa TaxID=93220 RepID=UPI0003C75A23|nr:glycine C-acetyltransferase [Pandoraea pnomenusa]AHB05461.1 2-amino-3-ketobutyrate CoA ligase [Pandoraea pnomenusa 3kgm]
MFAEALRSRLEARRQALVERHALKREIAIGSPQGGRITAHTSAAEAPRGYLNLCANNYLGLAGDARIVEAATEAISRFGLGMASVRFISGTHALHWELEQRLADFLGTEACALFPSAFDANGALFEALLSDEDAVFSDALNHASIIDGIRLSRAARFRYAHRDVDSAARAFDEANDARARLLVSDGVFSMDGTQAPLQALAALCRERQALFVVDDSHGIGVIGETGRGTAQAQAQSAAVDVFVGTLGKALGGAAGGFVAGPQAVVDTLRQFGRPYLFSNALMPAIAAAALRALDLIEQGQIDFARLRAMSVYLRERLTAAGFDVIPGDHPIVPVRFGTSARAQAAASALAQRGILAQAFSYPVVPEGQARLRLQASLALSDDDLDRVVEAFRSMRH